MRKVIVLSFLVSLMVFEAKAQASTRRLPSIINHPSLNLFAPYISLDGNALLFVSDYGQDGALIVSYTSREADWAEPIEIPKTINTRLNFLKGYALSADGKKMYYTSAKSPVIGGYDIFVSDLKGRTWSAGENLLMPINSKANEGCPSLSADGAVMYFMRCTQMDQNKADGCKILRTVKKSNGQWDEPVELPASINTGNSQTPRIMADGETLIFSSNKISPNKGGMDLYLSKISNGKWSDPVALDFVNTEKDDQYVSVAALGRYLLKESPGAKRNYELTEFLIPASLRPAGMMAVEGTVLDESGAPAAAYISVTDLKTNKRFFSGKPAANGSYLLYLREGTQYELSVDPDASEYNFFSKKFDLTTDKIPQKEKVNVTIKRPSAGEEINLDLVQFQQYSTNLESFSKGSLNQLARLIKANPALTFEIQVLLNGYEQDTIRSNQDLTEVFVDSLTTTVEKIDSVGNLYKADSLITKTYYHNNRTQRQADAITNYLIKQGVNPSSLTVFVNFREGLPTDLQTVQVKAVAKEK